VDFKGHFATDAQRCFPLTVLDDHSRYNVVLHALDNQRRESVQGTLQDAFVRYGLPERINVDNGSPWGSSTEGAITAFEVWLIRLGVHLSHSRPAHPQTNGAAPASPLGRHQRRPDLGRQASALGGTGGVDGEPLVERLSWLQGMPADDIARAVLADLDALSGSPVDGPHACATMRADATLA